MVKVSEKAIHDLLRAEFPVDRIALRSFLGLATYVCYTNVPHASQLLQPLWHLLSQDSWNVTSESYRCFQAVKDSIRDVQPRKFFEQHKPVVVQCEASGYGLGAVLLQDDAPVLYASRKLTGTEKRYSQIEKECLSIVFAQTRIPYFLLGRSFVVETDHKPLLQISKKPIDSMSMRLKRWMLALQSYDFDLRFIQGRANVLADALSHNPLQESIPSDEGKCESTICYNLKAARKVQ